MLESVAHAAKPVQALAPDLPGAGLQCPRAGVHRRGRFQSCKQLVAAPQLAVDLLDQRDAQRHLTAVEAAAEPPVAFRHGRVLSVDAGADRAQRGGALLPQPIAAVCAPRGRARAALLRHGAPAATAMPASVATTSATVIGTSRARRARRPPAASDAHRVRASVGPAPERFAAMIAMRPSSPADW